MLMITRSVRAGAAKHIAANMRLLSDARLTNETFNTAGRMGDDAAASVHEFMKAAEGAATSAGGRVTAGVFVASGAKVPNPDQASPQGGPLVGINSSIMGDMMDLVMAAFNGDHKRVVADVHDMARNQSIHVRTSSGIKLPRTTAQDWPRGSITDPAAARRPPPAD